MQYSLLIYFLLAISLYGHDDAQFTINLKDPSYHNGVISTYEEGVISSPGLRIQANTIEYTNTVENGQPIQEVYAEGNLMLDYGGLIFVGEKLTYDFIRNTGTVINGRTNIDVWFMGGDLITLNPDRSFYIHNAYVSTSDSQKMDWKIHSRKIYITKNAQLTTTNMTFRFFNTPIFWIPSFKSNLKTFSDSPARYNLYWETGQGAKLSMSYRIYSWDQFNLFARIDLRPKRGFGGAIESDFLSKNKQTMFQVKNYIAHDTFYNNINPNQKHTRFRFQGIFESENTRKSIWTYMSYDKISDRNMPGIFQQDDFELNTSKRTELIVRNFKNHTITGINLRPRINAFQGMKQELPTLFLSVKPFTLPTTRLIFQNHFKAAYLDYASANATEIFVPDFHAMRLETHNTIYHPFDLHFLTITPLIGFRGIYYNNNPHKETIGQTIFNYEININTSLTKHSSYGSHTLLPYCLYKGLSTPSSPANDYFIFSIQDGFHRLNEIKLGINNLFYLTNYRLFEPNFSADLYIYSLFINSMLQNSIPKASLDLTWNFPSLSLCSKTGWDIKKKILNHANILFCWTINADIAFNIEYRHRSRFDWRKNDHEHFVLDVTRSIPELLNSPLSDGRNAFLTKLELKITPQWTCRIQSHTGWGRKDEPSYNEATIDLITILSLSWKLKISYSHRVREGQGLFDPSGIGFNFALVNQ